VDEMLSTSDKLMYSAKRRQAYDCREIYSKHEQTYETSQSTNSNEDHRLLRKTQITP
jgi:hypothetical protein